MKDKTLKKENNLDNKIPLFGNESRSPDKKELDNDYVVIDNTNNMQKPNIKPNIVKNEWNNKKDDEKQRKLKEEEENQRKILEDIQKQRKLKEDEEMKLKSKEEEEKLRKIKEDDERLIRRREEEEKREKERKNVQKKDLIYDGEIENILNDADRSFDNIGGEKEGINIAAKQTKLNNGRSTSVITQDLKQNPNQAKPNPLKMILEAENLEKERRKKNNEDIMNAKKFEDWNYYGENGILYENKNTYNPTNPKPREKKSFLIESLHNEHIHNNNNELDESANQLDKSNLKGKDKSIVTNKSKINENPNNNKSKIMDNNQKKITTIY